MATAKIIQLVRRFTGSVITPGTIKYATAYTIHPDSDDVAEINGFELRVNADVDSVKINVTFGTDNLTGITPMIAIKANTAGSDTAPADISSWSILKLTDKPTIAGSVVTYTIPTPETSALTTPTTLACGCGICAYYVSAPSFTEASIYS